MAGERQWLSPYNYVQNNPIGMIDPDGMLDNEVILSGSIEYVVDKARGEGRFARGGDEDRFGDEDPRKKQGKGFFSTFWDELSKGDPFGNAGRTWRGWLSEKSTLGEDVWSGISDSFWTLASTLDGNTYMDWFKNQKAYWTLSSEQKGQLEARYLNSFIESGVTTAPLVSLGGKTSVINSVSQMKAGYGVRIGQVEFLYRNPRADGITIVAYKSTTGNKFRLDYHRIPNAGKSLHYHTNFFGNTLGPHRSLNPLNFGKPIK